MNAEYEDYIKKTRSKLEEINYQARVCYRSLAISSLDHDLEEFVWEAGINLRYAIAFLKDAIDTLKTKEVEHGTDS